MNSTKNEIKYIGRGECLPFNTTLSIIPFIENQLKKNPEHIVMRDGNQSLTCRDLYKKINQAANYLTSIGLHPGLPIILYTSPSISMIVALLALVKVKCFYIPVDIHYPSERINFMIKDSEASWIITETAFADNLPFGLNIINLENFDTTLSAYPDDFEPPLIQGQDLIYMIYTSGSTGVPKGVKISHCALNNHMLWMCHQFKFNCTDKVLLKTPLSFDPSIWELFIPLYSDAELVIAPKDCHIDPELMIDLINQYKITTIQFVPTILKLFLSSKRIKKTMPLKRVFVGGESLRPDIKTLFFKKLSCQLINLYGPTETTIDITAHIVLPSDIEINNIGKPIANTSIYLLNETGELTGKGETGEILIGSLNISEGYHRRQSLTDEHFIDNRFEPLIFKKLYKTGDLARWLPTGDLEYIGRNNEQIKVNGVRIEPKEIELNVLQHIEVSDCIIIKKIDSHGHDYLACYLIAKLGEKIDISSIKKSLKEKFPAFLLPKTYIVVEAFPLTPNGKIDINALPTIDFNQIPRSLFPNKNPKKYEEELLLLWQLVLEVSPIDIHDNFFDIGGNSLLAIKLSSLIQEKFQINLKISNFFEYQTIQTQTAHLEKCIMSHKKIREIGETPFPIISLQPRGNKTPLFLIHPIGGTVFWFSKLAKILGISRAIYGIQDPSIDLQKPIFNSIEEMASFYLLHIKNIQPQGPYLIGGASFGATVAAELSRLLSLESETVAALIILDGWGVYPNTLMDNNYFRQSMLRQHQELKIDFEHYGLPSPEVLFEIQWSRLQLLWNYHPALIEHCMVLCKAREIMPAFLKIDAPYNHWEEFTNQEIHLLQVPGNHETMFQEPHVYELGKLLNTYFDNHSL